MSVSSHRVLNFSTIDRNAARLAVRCTKTATAAELDKLNTNLLPRGLALVAGSGRVLDASGPRDLNHLVSVVASVCPVTQPATDAVKARYVALAGNMFLDPATNRTWVQADGVLRRRDNLETEEHLASLLSSVCPSAQTHEGRLVASSLGNQQSLESGKYCVYVNGATTLDGYIVAAANDGSSVAVLERESQKLKEVRTGLVIEAFDLLSNGKPLSFKDADILAKKIEAGASMSDAVAYYKKIYGYNPAYWAKFNAMLKSRGVY